MNPSFRTLAAFASTACFGATLLHAAAPKVEETIIGPAKQGGSYTVSTDVPHIAYAGMKGTKLYVNVDGVTGAEFDALYKTNGPEYFFSPNTAVYFSPTRSNDGTDGPVLFSADGSHFTYSGRQGANYIVIHDGKEAGRIPVTSIARPPPRLSPGGKHVYWHESRLEQGRSVGRLLVDGKATEWGQPGVPVFSPDDNHYAWSLRIGDSYSGKDHVFLDGKDTGYFGTSPVFTADSSVLLTIGNDNGKQSVQANGKAVYTGSGINKVVAGPVGKRWAAIVANPNYVDYRSGPVLVIDGKVVPGSEHVEDVWFSPDGRRYAARWHAAVGNSWGMVIDGDPYEFTRVDSAPPYWTPDSSKLIFTAGTASDSVVVVNDDMYPYSGAFSGIYLPKTGDHFGWGAYSGNRGGSVVINGQNVLPQGLYPSSDIALSPDGTRYAFTVAPVGRGNTVGVVFDGRVLQDFAPGSMHQWINDASNSIASFVFSPDSKHLAHAGHIAGAPLNSMYIDTTQVHPDAQNPFFTTFSPDSQHLYWMTVGAAGITSVYVDGQLAVKANGYFFREMQGAFGVDAQGVATFFAEDGDVVKRYRITPSSDLTVATLLERAGKAAAAPSPATPPPKPSASAAAAPAPATTAKPATPPPPTAGPTVTLTWGDLVRRPETRPLTCAVKRDYRFQGGGVVNAGSTVTILEVNPTELVVGTADGRINFGVKPDETNILDVANATWRQLTAAQRDLTYPALMQRQDLWPYHVKLLLPYELDGRRTRVGDSALLLRIEGGQLLVQHEGTQSLFNVAPAETDMMAQARNALADERGLPGRLLEEFNGKLVNPMDGRPAPLDLNGRPKYVVMYMGASWCAPCQQFSPKLVQVLKDKAPKPEDMTMIYVSGDRSPAEAKAYLTKLGIAWPTVYFKIRSQLPGFEPLFGDVIPQLVVTDRHGKIVVDSATVGYERALAQLVSLL